MRIFAIGDLHLSFSVDKPMDIFGIAWKDHAMRIAEAWREMVSDQDWVLVPGDISWAINEEQAKPDLEYIGALPGRKVVLRGNHDYWWSTIGKVRGMLPTQTYAIQNDALSLGSVVLAGTRGWLLPSSPGFSADDQRILQREIIRLELSLKAAAAFGLPIWAMMHYPPIVLGTEQSVFSELLEQYHVERCIYGHLHGDGHRLAVNGRKEGVLYQLTSADYLSFKPLCLSETDAT